MTILPDLSDLIIEQVSISKEVTVTVRAVSPTAPCPCCGTGSSRVQSFYTRTLRDLPASGRLVHLIVRVRRFFCQESTCVRKIFAERFPSLTLPRVKFTLRLQETLREMGFALGGEAGARLGKQLSMSGSPDTILRLVKGAELPAASAPRVVGIDDWSWKRRLRYGTLICDLESSRPIDVLPDRSVETVSAWFEHHRTVGIVSRDRSSEYAAGISKGAPQALQVADLWHIGKNLAESVSTLLARCRAEIRRGLQGQAIPEQEREEAEPLLEEGRRAPRSRGVELAREGRRAQKLDRYAQVVELHHQGVKAADIASRVGIGERTVHRWLRNGSFPEVKQRRRRPSLIDPYERYVLQWWQQGNRNGSQLYRELTSRGYKGSSKALYNYLATLRAPQSRSSKLPLSKPRERKSVPPLPAPLENFSAQRATWLFVCRPDELDQTQQAELALIRQVSPSAETAYCLAQAFMQMIREHTGHQLDTWLGEVEASHLPELESFAKGIQQDKAAVFAGLTLPWSTGPVEGHVNRLKLSKRSMYGRAKLPRLASTCASRGREAAFSRSCPRWSMTRLLSHGKQVRSVEPTHDESEEGGGGCHLISMKRSLMSRADTWRRKPCAMSML
jgi:transposase